ncbi:hypothetical protein G7Z17_g8299 [Cylindrodendrum hubeiense]|uniref:SGNH hydrolase-type esterase domain-containing protein n=1 Tax=Cylindrodendrum hubeiense TaxID=595255 RepID=A0A9P5HBH4_9HYPO|nr:hypothetical protein G7Z17_g8299 [Cylindrodendrum hubeiense]
MALKPLRILCFGDSLTSGYFCFGMDSHPYSLKLEDKLTGALPEFDVQIVTNGVPGDVATFKRFTDRMREECDKRYFDWAIVLAGTNDLAYGISTASIYESLQETWNIPLSKAGKVLALTVPECEARGEKLTRRRDELNNSIMNHQQPNFHSFDLKSHIPYHSLSEADREKYWDDGLHLRDDGYDWMGDHIANALIRIIREEGEPGPASATTRRRLSKQARYEAALAEETGNPRNISEGYVVVRKKDLD